MDTGIFKEKQNSSTYSVPIPVESWGLFSFRFLNNFAKFSKRSLISTVSKYEYFLNNVKICEF